MIRKLIQRFSRVRLRHWALVLLFLALPPRRAASAEAVTLLSVNDPGWRLQSSGGGIDLFGASIRGSGVVPLKATLTIPGTIEEVSLVLEDIPRREQWVGNRTESALFERNDYERTEYVHVNLPWPASDRTAIFRAWVTVSDDRKRATITGESVESPRADQLPRQVRARIHTSTFQMTQLPGRVDVVLLAFVDPGGWMPKWLVSRFTGYVARSTLVGLRTQVARKLYSARQLAAMRQRMFAYGRGGMSPDVPVKR